MRHTILATIMLVALSFSAEAYDFKSGDLCYNITSSTDYTVEVTKDNSYSSLSTITIPQIVINERKLYEVTSIGSNAFANSGLTSVTIPNSVTSIGEDAFSECSRLISVTFEENSYLTSIGENAFSGCSRLTSIIIPLKVTSIDKNAFDGCSGLTSITIPNSVKAIGDYAFNGCSGLASVTIPNSVTSIGDGAFTGCDNITTLTYNSNNIGLHFSRKSKLSTINIGDSVSYIYPFIFEGCSGLKSITIPNSVKAIGDYAFNGCSGLTSITIPNSVTSIGWGTFSGCSGLTSITIPNSVKSIETDAFQDCSGLTSVNFAENSQLTSIAPNAFIYCKGLKSITIPNLVTSIGYSAFSGCSSLIKVDYQGTIGDWLNIEFSNSNANPLYYAHHLYINNEEVTNVVIPDTITEIKPYAFSGCSGLTRVDYRGTIGDWLNISFGNTEANPLNYAHHLYINGKEVLNVVIPDTITEIKPYAFFGCSSLTSVTIPNSVKSIGNYAFEGCTSSVLYCQATEKPAGWANNWNYNGGFEVWGCKVVSLSANDNTFGTVTGGKDGLFLPNESVTISAIPAEHYHFAKWSDGDTENPRSITITSDTTLTAVFAIDTFKITAYTENGTVSGAGAYAYGASASLTASPAEHYHFTKWSDGSAENPRSITITSDTTLTAVFAIDTFKVNTFAENGTVSGAGLYAYGTQTSLTATPAKNFHFAKWNDGNTENPRSIKVTSDTTLIAVFAIDTLKVTASAENGTVLGAGEYTYGISILLVATPAEHYHFVKWNDNSTENPRSIKVTSDTTLIAVFAIDTLKVNTFAENGTVSGAGLYAYGTQTSLTATPAKNFHFAKWSDGNTENPRSITVTEDITLIAIFEKAAAIDTLKVTASAENGTVFGAGEYTYGISILLVATPAEHYHFAKWSDGNTENPRSIKVTSDTTLIAVFAIDTLKVNTFAENGTVSGAGLYAYGTQTSLTATPAKNFHFAKWSDGNTENPRSITVTEDITLIAIFEKADAIDTLKVTASAENGTVFGAGEFAYGTSILLGAIPAEHYHFAKWSDGNTENPRSITVTEDITLIAIFEKAAAIDTLKVTASAENGTVFGAGEFAYGATTSLTATPAEHYHFAKWNDNSTENPRSIKVTSDTTLIAVFAIDTLKVTAFAENGTVSGAGLYAYGTQTSLTATPAENYHFVKWSDGNTENPRSITVTEDITLIAIFEKADAISTDAVADVKIYAHHNVIVVENATDDIYVYDAMGRLIARRDVARHVSTEITMQGQGIYIVKVGAEAKRVMVW